MTRPSMEALGYTQAECPACKGAGKIPGDGFMVTCGQCAGYGRLFRKAA